MCVDTYKTNKPLVDRYSHPDSWTWIMAFDDRTWTGLLQHFGQEFGGQYIYARTDQDVSAMQATSADRRD